MKQIRRWVRIKGRWGRGVVGKTFSFLVQFEAVNGRYEGGKGWDGEQERGLKKITPSPSSSSSFIWEHLYDLLSQCLLCDKHFHLRTILKAPACTGWKLGILIHSVQNPLFCSSRRTATRQSARARGLGGGGGERNEKITV